jgi:nucleoid-associated protein YgaU
MPREPQFDLSRYKFSEVLQDSDENAYTEDREPPVYEAGRLDDILHTVKGGDTLISIAQTYYWDLTEYASELWWVLADMQPTPIINPFALLKPGLLIIVPAPERVTAEILAQPVEVIQ